MPVFRVSYTYGVGILFVRPGPNIGVATWPLNGSRCKIGAMRGRTTQSLPPPLELTRLDITPPSLITAK